jgi:hypothetical protein
MIEPAREQLVIVVKTAPALAIVGVRHVKFGPGILFGGIGATECRPGCGKLIVAEKLKAVVECLLIDVIGAKAGRNASGHFLDGLRLSGVQPDDASRVERGGCQTADTNAALACHHPIRAQYACRPRV